MWSRATETPLRFDRSSMSSTSPANLLDPPEMTLLEKMRLAPRRTFSGRVRGERLSRQKGLSVEFADYRDYSDGDDLRHLDWAILARLDRPTIRTYQDEDDLAVYVALDASLSMDFGDPTKFSHATRLASAFAYLGLVGQDAVYPVTLGHPAGRKQPLRGRGSYRRVADWLASIRPDGQQGLAASLLRFAASNSSRPGMFVCLTDGLDPDIPNALRAVEARGHELVIVQILSEIEIDPDLEGDLRLLDADTGAIVEVTAHAQTLREYQQNLTAHCKLVEETTVRAGGRYLYCVVGQPLSEFITHDLAHAGLVH